MDPLGVITSPSELSNLDGGDFFDFKCNIQIIGCFIEAS